MKLEGPLPPLPEVLMAQQLGTVVFAAAPLLSHVLPIEEIEEAFRLADAVEDGVLKVSVSF